jgi:hypothetical protein
MELITTVHTFAGMSAAQQTGKRRPGSRSVNGVASSEVAIMEIEWVELKMLG